MKKLLMAGALGAAFAASPAAAQSATAQDQFFVTANVQFECSVDDPTNVNFGNLDIEEGSGANALQFDQTRYVERQRIWTSCNYPATIELAALPMVNQQQTNDGPDQADFTDTLHYRIRLRADNNSDFETVNLRTVDGEGGVARSSLAQTGAFHNRAVLRTVLNVNDQDSPRPLAGFYSGIAQVTLGAI